MSAENEEALAAEFDEFSDPPGEDEGASVELDVRPFMEQDARFILATWLKSYRDFNRKIPSHVYFAYQQKLIQRIAQSEKTIVAVCCGHDDPTFIAGFTVAEKFTTNDPKEALVVHYSYLKLTYRHYGLCLEMLKYLGWRPERYIYMTHWTPAAQKFMMKHPIRYNPYPLMELGYEWSPPPGHTGSADTPRTPVGAPLNRRSAR